MGSGAFGRSIRGYSVREEMFAASAFLDRFDTDVEGRTLPGTDPAFCVIGCNPRGE
jgi:hypothetical protein